VPSLLPAGCIRQSVGHQPACTRVHAICVCHTFRLPAGFQSLELVKSKEMPGQNRGFCFVEFLNSACAAHAKNALSPPGYTCVLYGHVSKLHCCLQPDMVGHQLATMAPHPANTSMVAPEWA